MEKLTDIFCRRPRTLSFEIFPPKSDQGLDALRAALDDLTILPFDFVSVTYGAGGSSRAKTCGLVREVQERFGRPAVHHFTCVCHTRSEIKGILQDLCQAGVRNILALRGDPPKDNPGWTPGPEHFQHSMELVGFIRAHFGDTFSVGVAGFPEGHPLAPDREFDADILKRKIEAGGDYVMTQLFFDNDLYFDYVARLHHRGVTVRVIPGVLPVTSYEGVVNFCRGCGATVPPRVHELFAPIAGDREKTVKAGIRFAVEQCRDLLARGAPGIHFYSLNKAEPVRSILRELGDVHVC